jgi:hypothetical protein
MFDAMNDHYLLVVDDLADNAVGAPSRGAQSG